MPTLAPHPERATRGESDAAQVAAFYKALRARGVPAGAAQAVTEAYVVGLMEREPAPPPPPSAPRPLRLPRRPDPA